MKQTEHIKAVYDHIKKTIRSKCSDAEWLALKHIISMEISGCAVGLCMLLVHFLASRLFHKNIGLHFFEHLSSVDSEFILSGLATTGILFMLSGWFLEARAYRYIVKPWLGLIIHSFALLAGAAVPIGIGEGFSEMNFISGLGLAIVIFLSGNLIAVFFSLLSIGANPEQSTQQSGAIDGIFKVPMLRFLFGLISFIVYFSLQS